MRTDGALHKLRAQPPAAGLAKQQEDQVAKLTALNRRLAQLYDILQEGDAPPTTQAVQAIAQLRQEVAAALAPVPAASARSR